MAEREARINLHDSSKRPKYDCDLVVDRISALPDSILSLILSILPTKNAVATSILSKRWKFAWVTVSNLDFCCDILREEDYESEVMKFVPFVNRVLLLNDAGVLNKFRLVWIPCIESHATSWIKTAITRNVHELSLTLVTRLVQFSMPMSVFSCDSLQSLHLAGWICLSAATVFRLPRLESLDLYGVQFQSDEDFEKIIRGCPVLNYLHINMEEDDDEFRFIISSTSLRRLELNLGLYKYLKLEASSLEHLEIYGYISVNFVPKKLSSLVIADFQIYMDYEEFPQAGICNSMVDALSAFVCVKILTLSSDVMRAFSCATINLYVDFKRLVKLETSIVCCDWSSLLDLIQRSNNLEKLTINKCQMHPDDDDHSNCWTTPVEVPRCLSNRLKKVVLRRYDGYEDECEMIPYMLKHGSVLEEMLISCHRDKNLRENFELLQEICQFPRMSPACEVKFFEGT